jgi:hypothetical protein
MGLKTKDVCVCVDVDYIHLAQDRIQCRGLVSKVMNLRLHNRQDVSRSYLNRQTLNSDKISYALISILAILRHAFNRISRSKHLTFLYPEVITT